MCFAYLQSGYMLTKKRVVKFRDIVTTDDAPMIYEPPNTVTRWRNNCILAYRNTRNMVLADLIYLTK